jgi:predicted dehydrogenase
MNDIRLAIIGTGHLGRIHTRLARSLKGAQLVGIVEPVDAAREAVAKEFGTTGYAKYGDILAQIDAAIVAAPTCFHHQISMDLIRAGKHVLVEKPITTTVTEAEELIAAAEAAGVVLAVGHVERFNPAYANARPHIRSPKYIEACRTSGFTFRSTDVGVVLDIMIHDIDAVLALVDSPLVDVQALGVTLFGPHEDMVQARLTFASGTIANISGSRCSYAVKREMKVYGESGYAGIDFGTREACIVSPGAALAARGIDIHKLSADQKQHIREKLFADPALLPMQEIPAVEANPLQDEQQDFCDAIREGRAPRVTGQAGRDALWTAQRILRAIARHQWDGSLEGRIGPNVTASDALPLRKAA